METYYQVALDVIVILGIGVFLWSIAHSFRLIAESIVKSRPMAAQRQG